MDMSEAYFARGCGTCESVDHKLDEDSDLYHSNDVYELVSRTKDEIVCISCNGDLCNNVCKTDLLAYAGMRRNRYKRTSRNSIKKTRNSSNMLRSSFKKLYLVALSVCHVLFCKGILLNKTRIYL